jgi:hypothetical protein
LGNCDAVAMDANKLSVEMLKTVKNRSIIEYSRCLTC